MGLIEELGSEKEKVRSTYVFLLCFKLVVFFIFWEYKSCFVHGIMLGILNMLKFGI